MSDTTDNQDNTNKGALEGITVIDASRVLGAPYCTQILADHGADVIKVEPPAGDETRTWGPPFLGDAASYFLGLNRNKKGIALDLSQPAGREVLMHLLENADVFVENFKIGTLEKWGIGYEELHKRFPALIHCRVSGFGADGPYGGMPGYDAAIQAIGGIMSVNGEKGGEPLRVGLPVVDMVTGLNAAVGVLLALQERVRSGEGQFVESALYDNAVSLLHPHLPNYYLNGKVPKPSGNAHPNITPYDTYATATGPLFLAIGNNRQFRNLCSILELGHLADDARFATTASRNGNRDALKTELEAGLAKWSCDEIADKLITSGVPCGPVRDVGQVVDCPHTQAREMIVDIGDYRGTGSPIKLSRTPASYRLRPPGFAQHTEEVMQEFGLDSETYRDVLPKDPQS